MLNLIIDGNYILSKWVFSLHKNNLLYGDLHRSLELTFNGYKNLYHFNDIYLVSDSREKSWRKSIYSGYKGKRKKDEEIDWDFVYTTYNEFKNNLNSRIKVMESSTIEGDDWISFLTDKSNDKGISTLIISNDFDIKQKLKLSLDPLYINMMSNEMFNKEKLFLPKNWRVFINKLRSIPNDDIFNPNDSSELLFFIEKLIEKNEVSEADHLKTLIVKLISGDISDNILSAYGKIGTTGKRVGIGDKGANDIYDLLVEQRGGIIIEDDLLYDDISKIICDVKKLNSNEIKTIKENLTFNAKLIDLSVDKLPEYIRDKMIEIYDKK